MKPLDVTRFEQLLELYGARLERWPAREAERARTLLASSPEARQGLRRAERLEAAFDDLPQAPPSSALSARILALPRRHPREHWSWWPFSKPWVPVGVWGAALALGLWTGAVTDLELYGWGEPSQQTAGADEEWAELVDLGFARELSGEEGP